MSYIGQGLPADVFSGFTTDAFTGNGSDTTFTLSKAPFSEDGLIVVINNVIQRPTTNFTVSGTTLTIVGTAVASGDVIYAIHTSGAVPSTLASKVDVNGLSDGIILDADADTTISADTDDQIDFKAGGTDRMSVTSSGIDVTGAITASSASSINVTGGSALTLTSTDAGSSSGPVLRLNRNSGSPADSDFLGQIDFGGRNDNSEDVVYASILNSIDDASDGTEDTQFTIKTMKAGSLDDRLTIGSNITVFNDGSKDVDFRIEGNGDANLFKINAGTDQVFINGNAQDLASNGLNISGDGNDFAMGVSNQDTSSGISFMKFTDGSGDQCGLITGDAGNNSLSLSSGSDYRLKENINYSWDATTELKKLKPAQFNMKKNTEKTILNGFIAHEIAEVLPEVVIGKKDETETFENVVLNSNGIRIHRGITEEQWKEGKDKGKYAENTTWQASQTVDKMQTVDYAKLTPLLTKALQELEARIKTLEDA